MSKWGEQTSGHQHLEPAYWTQEGTWGRPVKPCNIETRKKANPSLLRKTGDRGKKGCQATGASGLADRHQTLSPLYAAGHYPLPTATPSPIPGMTEMEKFYTPYRRHPLPFDGPFRLSLKKNRPICICNGKRDREAKENGLQICRKYSCDSSLITNRQNSAQVRAVGCW